MALFRHWDYAVIRPTPQGPDSRRKGRAGLYTEVPDVLLSDV